MELRKAVRASVALASAMFTLSGGGCLHRTDGGAEPGRRGQDSAGETLRVARQSLLIEQTPALGYTVLRVAPPDGHPAVVLDLRPEEVELLRSEALSGEVEIRYWESASRFISDGRGGPGRVGELDSILDGPRLLLDRGLCPLHQQRMARQPALVIYGLPADHFSEAWKRFFPNAALALGGCVVEENSPRTELKHVCATCQTAYEQWTAAGGGGN